MQAEKADHSVRALCRALGVSASGFYAWQQRPEPPRAVTDRRLRIHLRAAHAASRGSYGSPRLQRALRAHGFMVGRNRIIRLMRAEQVVGRPRKRFRVTTGCDATAVPAPNHLAQAFTAAKPNRVWAADITAIPAADGWLYLAVLLNLYSRRVVGWALAPTLRGRFGRHGVASRARSPSGRASPPSFGPWCQYTSAVYQRELASHQVRCSMSRPGNCFDKAVVESFFRTLKLDLGPYLRGPRSDIERAVTEYIEDF